MSNGYHSNSTPDFPVHPKGVLLNFPAPASPADAPTADAIALATDPIPTTQDQACDQLTVDSAEEMWPQLDQFSSGSLAAAGPPDTITRATLSRDELPESPSLGLRQAKDSSQVGHAECHRANEKVSVQLEMKHIRPRRSWLERWLFPANSDKRRVARELTPGLTAQFWTGGPPQAHDIRDISTSGLYVVTEDRWYLGTQILMTLSKPAGGSSHDVRSITMHAIAVRWGSDGVGLAFLLRDYKNRHQPSSSFEGADRKQFEQFLKDLKSGTLDK